MAGIDINNMNDYYNMSLKEYRFSEIERCAKKHLGRKWTFIKGNIPDKTSIDKIFAEYKHCFVVL